MRSWGSQGAGPAQLKYPFGIAVHGNRVLVSDVNQRVSVFGTDGSFVRSIGSYGAADHQFQYPCGIACTDRAVYVADRENLRVRVLDAAAV